MAENASGPGEADTASGAVADPAAPRPGGPLPGDGESIVIPPSILKQQAGWAQPGQAAPAASGTPKDDEPQVFASTVRKEQQSEADYDKAPGVGRLGAVLASVLAVLLIGSGVALYEINKPDNSSSSSAADSATATPSAPASPSAPAVPPIKTDAKVLPTVTGDVGKKATITLPTGGSPDGNFVVKPLVEGDGAKADKGSWVTADFTLKDWNTGKDISGSYDQGQPQIFQAGTGQLIPALDASVVGAKAGSRLLVVAPPAAAFGSQGNPSLGLGATDTLVMVIDVDRVNAPGARVSGDVTAPPADFPQVKENPGKPDTITPPAGVTDPTALKTAVLIQGKGPKVASGEKVVVQYTGALLKDGKEFDSSIGKTAFSFVTGGGNVIAGWDQGVVGQNVGSRIELVIPASLAYKDQAQSGIPANSSLVFVIDILDAGVGSAN
ncbi:FKBP-type peptidyl-prolyl cis-trans isomerase [Kitasatospora mediocidica]|uniref:FKBP-type peptidyl-prolyl cis-trans isomerase n=1 Tax=Kitasatospora mediocidica TaxID=58352 RepID=UPI00068A764B|nr:FKBP-type peptidyl-prolyl cis-trans isomerase [Kitasatospora mediocidica]